VTHVRAQCSALESVLDMMTNAMSILAVSIASHAPDEDHSYGHEKFETLGTLDIVGFLSISCFELLHQSFAELAGRQQPPAASGAGAAMMIASLAARGRVSLHQRRADHRVERIQILRDPIPILVDARAVEAARLSEIVRTIPGVVGVRSARSRRTSSGHLFADVTILVDGASSVSAAHDFADDVERAIERELGTAEAIGHVEPA
jgi:divalent metal cation (Fe/Co/Zn/Cd) transporter